MRTASNTSKNKSKIKDSTKKKRRPRSNDDRKKEKSGNYFDEVNGK